jgi:hypothetical protein
MLHYTLYSLFAASVAAQSFRPDPRYVQPRPLRARAHSYRWGPAFTSFRGHLVVHGGKTNPGNGYTYSSGPTSSDLFALDLTSSFPVSNPPWRQITDSYNSSSSQGPPASFHTLSAFSSSQLLLFGGDAGAQIALPTGTDSAWVLGLDDFSNVSWSRNPQNLASEPVRTQNHAATAIGNQVWIIGGERLDGSAIVAQTFTYAGSSFDLFDSPLPLPPIAGHRALTITDGRIITLGGRSNPSSTPNSMSSLYALNASADPVSWTQVPATGNIPSARRNFVATTLSNNRIIIHGGAGDSFNPPQNILSDGFILDASQDPMIWRHIPSLSELGPRTDHIAISRGSLVLFLFGAHSYTSLKLSLTICVPQDGAARTPLAPTAGSTIPNQTNGSTSGTQNQHLPTQLAMGDPVRRIQLHHTPPPRPLPLQPVARQAAPPGSARWPWH